MISTFTLVVIVVIIALVFDFVNGFHDAANAIATIVVSKTLTPLQAVVLAGIANFVGFFTFGLAVATMIGRGVVHIDQVTLPLLLTTLLGAVLWNVLTWLLGLPTSSSHALIGGLVGSGIAAAAFVLIGTAHFGIPVSTTHVISGSIMGVGAVEHAAKVRWITARKILWAWILTIPTSAFFAGISYLALGPFLLSHIR